MDNYGRVETLYQGTVNKSQNQTTTTNHIYLHPGERSGEFERWMGEIGSCFRLIWSIHP
ncbi:MAG: hypothetical protein K0R59_3048 [Sphingobacterium sp.]|jgi:hypothetical protein|uniref:hypothetical protein n=1 Tax=Sphingobacterium sp. NGMCC 1.201703 TaxID=3388657 RepID=UPI002A64E36F|nr:hypothetical protein [Sphingobacterium sp.]